MEKPKMNRTLWRFLLILYGSIMLWLLFVRSNRWADGIPYKTQLLHNANFTPFHTIGNYITTLRYPYNRQLLRQSIINLGGNVILFIPAGWLFPQVWPFLRKFFVFLAFCTGVILLVEIVQLFTFLGCFDVDDLILNLAGMCMGYVLFKLCAKG